MYCASAAKDSWSAVNTSSEGSLLFSSSTALQRKLYTNKRLCAEAACTYPSRSEQQNNVIVVLYLAYVLGLCCFPRVLKPYKGWLLCFADRKQHTCATFYWVTASISCPSGLKIRVSVALPLVPPLGISVSKGTGLLCRMTAHLGMMGTVLPWLHPLAVCPWEQTPLKTTMKKTGMRPSTG